MMTTLGIPTSNQLSQRHEDFISYRYSTNGATKFNAGSFPFLVSVSNNDSLYLCIWTLSLLKPKKRIMVHYGAMDNNNTNNKPYLTRGFGFVVNKKNTYLA